MSPHAERLNAMLDEEIAASSKPLCIDLFCGLGGWAEGFLAEGFEVVGYDVEAHDYGTGGYPGRLVLRDVLTIHGSEFKDAAVIVASPPCQHYSYMAMPWSRAKAIAAEIEADTTGAMLADLNALFDACFRIQREACEAAGRHIPLIVENVRGAQKWVGRSKATYGAFHLWGDVPALMPIRELADGRKQGGDWFNSSQPSISRQTSSRSKARRKAVAQLSKIPFHLSSHLARVFKPESR